jgi:hypothetical protein
MRLAAVLAVVAVGSLIVVIAPAGAGPATGTLLIHCDYAHSAPNDPIVFPGRPGASHSHDFFGSKGIDAGTTARSLRVSPTTCSFEGDRSGYWVPSLRVPSGRLVAPTGMRVYYRGGDRDPMALKKFPAGLKHLQGDARNTNPSAYAATYRCNTGALTGPYIPQACAGDSGFEASYYFPFCATGETDNPAHKTLVGKTFPCPDPQLSVLQMQMIVSYPPEAAGGRLVSDELAGAKGGLTSHADFFDGWNPEALDMVLERCIRPNATCQVDDDGNVYRTGTNTVAIRAATFAEPSCDQPTVCPSVARRPVPQRPSASAPAPAPAAEGATTSPPTEVAGSGSRSAAGAMSAFLGRLTDRLVVSDPRRLGRSRVIATAVSFPAPGRMTLIWRLRVATSGSASAASGRSALVLGRVSLARRSAGKAGTGVRITAAGRRVLRRARTVRTVLHATFTPAAGGRPTTIRRPVLLGGRHRAS